MDSALSFPTNTKTAFGVDVVLPDEAFMFENQQLTVPTPDFLTLS
jgi:mRNA degradation ribonuclease J1/J2